MLIAIVTGYILASIESRVSELKALIEQLNALGLTVARQVCSLVPFFVGLLLCLKIWTHDTGLLGAIWAPLVVSVAICVFILFAAQIQHLHTDQAWRISCEKFTFVSVVTRSARRKGR